MSSGIEQILPTYEEQKALLLDIQAMQERVLHEAGTTKRAYEALTPFQLRNLAGLATRMMVGQLQEHFEHEEPIVRPQICLITRNLHANGNVSFARTYLPVGEVFANTIMPNPSFTMDDAELAFSMLEGLDEARRFGFLPDLAADYLDIRNCATALSKLPD